MKETKAIDLEHWKLALRIMKGELDEQLDEIIASYHVDEEEEEEARNE